MSQFSSENQPSKRKGRGKSFKTRLFDAIREQAILDCDKDTSDKNVEAKFLSHVAKRAFDSADPASGTLLKELVSKTYASIKPTLERVEFDFDATKLPHEQAAQILQAAADGHIPPDVASIFIGSIKSNVSVEFETSIKVRLAELEKLLDERLSQEA